MNIRTAVKKAIALNACVTRKGWPFTLTIKPTNSVERCIVYVDGDAVPRWQPNAEDLAANDWIIVNTEDLS